MALAMYNNHLFSKSLKTDDIKMAVNTYFDTSISHSPAFRLV